jgi:processive 1,2-diacylglycerol beta-glucosyltransferase
MSLNIYRVTKDLFRGPRPKREDIPELKRAGIKTVVNLRAFHSNRKLIIGSDMNYVHIPMKTWRPKREHIMRFLKIATDPDARPVFVHCWQGVDRTGLMCAVYRMAVCGWTRERAVKEMKKFGAHKMWRSIARFVQTIDIDNVKEELKRSKAKTLLILSVSAGAGHVRAAEALKAWTGRKFPAYNPVHLDVMDYVPRLFKKLYAESFLKIVARSPALWGYIYDRTDRRKENTRLDRLRLAIQKINTARFRKKIKELCPDRIICTHFLPCELLSRDIAKKRLSASVWVVVTDFDVHRFWIHKHMKGYFVAADQAAAKLADRGIDPSNIHVTGIPVMPEFARSFSRKTCASRLGLDHSKPTLIFMSGGFGIGRIDELAQTLLNTTQDIQIITLAGRNLKLLKSLESLAKKFPGRLVCTGFTGSIEKYMAAADLAVTKPGGLTTSECLAVGLPMIIINPIPGQEERNADLLLENGAGLKAHDGAGLIYRVRELFTHKKRLETMGRKARRLGRPGAGREILKKVLG